MLKRLCICLISVVMVGVVGYVVYADSRGLFLEDDDSAKELVDKYVTSVLKNYTADNSKSSFRGIVKQGCDFWYYNEYKNSSIAKSHSEGSELEVKETGYTIDYNSVNYYNRMYTIDATITQIIHYKNNANTDTNVSRHIFTIEQDGHDMYIINDEKYDEYVSTETGDTPENKE